MWINANKRKPDSFRRVFIREGNTIALAKWLDFDNHWGAFVSWDGDQSIYNIEYWCEITDILNLPIAGDQAEDSKIDVPVG